MLSYMQLSLILLKAPCGAAYLLNPRQRVIWVYTPEDGRIHHHPPINVDLCYRMFYLLVSKAILKPVVHALKRNKLLATLDELISQSLGILVVFQWVSREASNLLMTFEIWDPQKVICETKDLAVVLKVTPLNVTSLAMEIVFRFPAVVDFEAARVIFIAISRCECNGVRLVERPEKTICDCT